MDHISMLLAAIAERAQAAAAYWLSVDSSVDNGQRFIASPRESCEHVYALMALTFELSKHYKKRFGDDGLTVSAPLKQEIQRRLRAFADIASAVLDVRDCANDCLRRGGLAMQNELPAITCLFVSLSLFAWKVASTLPNGKLSMITDAELERRAQSILSAQAPCPDQHSHTPKGIALRENN